MSTHTIQPAASDVAREINRAIVLNLIRTRQPISRADLARASGLQRSTISLIVEQLVAEHWVLEGPTARLPRGRRPTHLRLNEDRVIIGVDIRPGQISVALADVNGEFIHQSAFPTPRDPQAAIAGILSIIQPMIQSCSGKKIEGIGISLPGRFNAGRLVFAPNLKWPDVDLRTPIAEATGLEVAFENAANACCLAAAWFGGAGQERNVVVITVSEGIGAGVMVNGQLARGLGNMAGEFGHVPIDPNGPLCSCGSRGCWEVFASNRAALRYYRESGKAPDNLTFHNLLELADGGDCRAAAALESMARQLGHGMRIIVAGLAPERIIVIGDLTRAWHRFGPIIEAELQSQVLSGGSAPALVPADEDGTARLRGTVALVLQKHFSR